MYVINLMARLSLKKQNKIFRNCQGLGGGELQVVLLIDYNCENVDKKNVGRF